jgi:hypothetical protein
MSRLARFGFQIRYGSSGDSSIECYGTSALSSHRLSSSQAMTQLSFQKNLKSRIVLVRGLVMVHFQIPPTHPAQSIIERGHGGEANCALLSRCFNVSFQKLRTVWLRSLKDHVTKRSSVWRQFRCDLPDICALYQRLLFQKVAAFFRRKDFSIAELARLAEHGLMAQAGDVGFDARIVWNDGRT